MEQEFLSLTQGSMTVLEYEARFAELSKYAPHIVADERRKAKKFVMGLKPSLRMRLVVFDHRTLDEALSAACRQEGEMEKYLEEKNASQKRPAAMFQLQDKKKAVYQTQQRSVAVDSTQRPQDQGLSETSVGSSAWSVSPSSSSSNSASYRKTRKALSPSSSVCSSTRGRRAGGACHRRNLAGKLVISAMKAMRMVIPSPLRDIPNPFSYKPNPFATRKTSLGSFARGEETLTLAVRKPEVCMLCPAIWSSSGDLQQLEASWSLEEDFPDSNLLWRSTKNPKEWCFGGFLGLPKEIFINLFDPFEDLFRGK
ncbi:hypothetical protein Taro_052412 [Colocasia esculenta]|uniref:Retrotransposon gag domain-containing protein n=1 Tax=Colocasia esculenta TaxID=4460 RepID=A0A843XID4_COLES|nr:hypothetical protein [Colocasia esculenta]